MNGALGRRRYGLRSTLLTVKPTPSSRSASPFAPVSSSSEQVLVLESARRCRSRGPWPADGRRRRRSDAAKDSGSNVAFDIPPAGADEGHALALALHDQACRHGLDAAGGEPARDLAPEDGRDLVAVQAVEDPPGLLRVDQAHVDLPRLLERALDRRAGDLVEDHPPDRHLRLQHLDQVPGDGLALAILVRREQELLRVGQPLAQLADLALLVGVDDVQRLEVVLDVDAQTRPGLLLELVRNLLRAGRQVANVADRGIDHEVVAEVRGDRPRLRRGLDDHQPFACFRCCHERMTLATVPDRLCAENASDTPKRRVRRYCRPCPSESAIRCRRPSTTSSASSAGRSCGCSTGCAGAVARTSLRAGSCSRRTTTRTSTPGRSATRSGPSAGSGGWESPSSSTRSSARSCVAAAPFPSGAGRTTARRSSARSSSRTRATSSSCSRRARVARKASARSTGRTRTRVPRGSRSSRASRSSRPPSGEPTGSRGSARCASPTASPCRSTTSPSMITGRRRRSPRSG